MYQVTVHGPCQVSDLRLAGERQVNAAPRIAPQNRLKPQHRYDITGREAALARRDLSLLSLREAALPRYGEGVPTIVTAWRFRSADSR